MNQLEIALHHTIFSWLPMDGYVCIIEGNNLSILQEREVILVNWCCNATWKFNMPVHSLYIYDINIVPFLVKEGI